MRRLIWAVVISGALCFAPALFAQHVGGAGVAGGAHLGGGIAHAGAVAHGGGFGRGVGRGPGHGPGFGGRGIPFRNGVVGGHPRYYGRGYYNNPYNSPYLSGLYWWGDDYGSPDADQQVVLRQPPAPVVVQAPPAPQPVPAVKPASPLLIELQGNRFVSLTGNAVNPPAGSEASTQAASPGPSQQLPAVVLVFRDGHRQEVTSYSIIGPAIYASGSYWTNGYWTQKILLADLNLPATFQVNQEHGVKFVLPSAPDQVVTRP